MSTAMQQNAKNVVTAILLVNAMVSAELPSYNVPRAQIEVFYPRGFRVSIPNEPGLVEFGFHGNVNKPILDLENGEHSGNVLKPKNGRWTYENRDAVLKEKDLIYYWLFVIKDNLGYIEDRGVFLVGDLLVTTTERLPTDPSVFPIDQPTVTQMIPEQPYTVPSVVLPPKDTVSKKPYSTTETPSDDIKTSLRLATSIYNTVENLTVEIKRLREINSILVELVEQNKTLSKSLTLSGTLPPYDDDIYIAQVIIKEKLGLHNLPVVSAVRNSDGSISFDMASLNDKIQVIKSARHMLRDSKIKLVY